MSTFCYSYVFIRDDYETPLEQMSELFDISQRFGSYTFNKKPFNRMDHPAGSVAYSSTSPDEVRFVKVANLAAILAVEEILKKFQYTYVANRGDSIITLPVDRHRLGPLSAFNHLV